MKLFNNKDFRVLIADIETLRGCVDLGFYNPDTEEWYEFEISQYRNDLNKFAKFYNEQDWDYCVYYNGIAFDGQVIQYILNNYSEWYDLNGLEICSLVYRYAQKVIDDKNYGLFAQFREEEFTIRVIDVYTILGLDNEARRSSLKKCEFQLDYPCVEEMPIFHGKADFTQEEISEVKSYRRNDVLATYEVFKLVLGQTTHPLYKDNNQLQLRMDIQQEFGIRCLNYADIKIGDEILKHSYANAIGKQVSELPKKGFFRKEIKLKNCIPSYVSFKTTEFKKLLTEAKKESVKQNDSFEREFVFRNTKYKLAKGGLHAENKNEVWEAKNGMIIEDDDVASYYPRIIINNNIFPQHLGKEILKVYELLYNRRVELKPQSKKDKRIKGIVEALKLALNAVFGKLGSMESWLFDAQALFSVTLTGEFSLLMLIEMFEEAGIHVISANTDGVTTYFPEDKKELKDTIVKRWQELTNFEIETVRFKRFWYSTVNDYIAEKTDGEKWEDRVKKKGDFITDFELWKNKSWRIIPLALEDYFKNGTDPIRFINSHNNIYDFCIMARATGNLHLEEQIEDGTNIEIKKHKKLIRYYLSNNSKSQLYKRGVGSTGKQMNVNLNAANEMGEIYIQYFNQYEKKAIKDYNIATEQYIYKTLKFIDKIHKTKKAQRFYESLKPAQQIFLFGF